MTSAIDHIRSEVLTELADRYTALPDNYRQHVRFADETTLRRVWQLATADAPGHDICLALGLEPVA